MNACALDHPASTLDESTDGRVLRRSRNMESVRAAVVELLAENADLSIPVVAARAGVAGRSVYRYYGDLASAVRDAVLSRLELVMDQLPDPASIDTGVPLSQRIENVCRHRVEMWWTIAPILGHLPDTERDEAMERFDAVALTTFRNELATFDADERRHVESTLAVMLRMRSIDALAGRHGHDPIDTAKALRFGLARLLDAS